MLTGTFNAAQGIYQFNGHHYKPRWYANSIRNTDIREIYNLVVQGYDAKPNPKWQKTILVTYKQRWDIIKQHYEVIYAMAQLHYYDDALPIGQVPAWAAPFQQSGGALIHEYAPGKIAWLRDESKFANDVYLFFLDSPPPAPEPTPPPPVAPLALARNWLITGTLGFFKINLTIKGIDNV